MAEPLRFGLVGAGTHGRTAVIPAFAQATGCKLLAVADSRPESLEALEGNGLQLFSTLDEMLEREKPDALYIATLADAHGSLALKAMDHGLHVLCEKPMAKTAQEAEVMLAAATASGRLLRVMFESRVRPVYRQIRQWIATGALGRVEAIHLQSFGKHPTAQPRRTHLLNASGCLDCGVHMLDLARYWTGGGRWETIHALGTWFGEDVERAPHMGILARLDSGVMVTFEDSFSYGYRLQNVPWNFGRSSLAIVGIHGVVTEAVRSGERGFELVTDAGTEWVAMEPTGHAHEIARVLDLFADEAAGRGPKEQLLATGLDGLEAQRIVDEVNRQCIASAPRFPR